MHEQTCLQLRNDTHTNDKHTEIIQTRAVPNRGLTLGGNVIHRKKNVLFHEVFENMPNFTENGQSGQNT